MIPSKFIILPGEEAENLRYHMLAMAVIHCFCILLHVVLYEFQFMHITTHGIYVWIAFSCFMLMNKYAIYLYVVLMFLSVFKLFMVYEVGIGFVNTPIFIIQVLVMVLVGGW